MSGARAATLWNWKAMVVRTANSSARMLQRLVMHAPRQMRSGNYSGQHVGIALELGKAPDRVQVTIAQPTVGWLMTGHCARIGGCAAWYVYCDVLYFEAASCVRRDDP
jgi:hypothetical protein